MKPAGQVAYDAFRKDVEWLVPWEKLSEEMQQAWNNLANESMTFSDGLIPA